MSRSAAERSTFRWKGVDLHRVVQAVDTDTVRAMCRCLSRLPPLQTRFDYHSLVLLYNMRSSLAPPYLCSLLPRQASASTGYSFRKSGYPVPATRKSSTLASFVPRSIVLWNGLPKEIQESKTLTNFKTRLRTHLHIWCQQSHALNSRGSTLLFIYYFFFINS